jgi:hypothetical protein
MKYFTMSIFLLMGILLFIYSSGCRVQWARPDTYTGRQLIFGNGGGFTGAVLPGATPTTLFPAMQKSCIINC